MTIWLTTKALPFGKASSRLRLGKVSPDLWPAALKSASLRWHTVSRRSDNESGISARIRTSHGALISRNYRTGGQNREVSREAHGTESIFRKPGNILRGHVEILHLHFARTRRDSAAVGRRYGNAASRLSLFAPRIITLSGLERRGTI